MRHLIVLIALFLLASPSLGDVEMDNSALMSNSVFQQVISALINSSSLQLNPDKFDVTEEEKIEFVETHNRFRRQVNPSASNMRQMSWHNGLESMAQEWADGCLWQHGQPPNPDPPFNPIGQNLWAGTGGYSPEGAVTMWHSEEKDYDYESNTCSAVCGHYTQVVWANSYALGCGIRFCPDLVGAFQNAYYIVCNYGPAGNYVGQRPYDQGTSCSQCPSAAPNCNNNLCSASTSNDGEIYAVGDPEMRGMEPAMYTDAAMNVTSMPWFALLMNIILSFILCQLYN